MTMTYDILAHALQEEIEDEVTITDAFENSLLPHLSEDCQRQVKVFQPLEVFHAVQTVAEMIIETCESSDTSAVITLDQDCQIAVDGKVVLDKKTIIEEICIAAEIVEDDAEDLTRWIPSAAACQSNLFPGVDIEINEQVLLISLRDAQELWCVDLLKLWKIK